MVKCSRGCGTMWEIDPAVGEDFPIPTHYWWENGSLCPGSGNPGVRVAVYVLEHPDDSKRRVWVVFADSFDDAATQCGKRIRGRQSETAVVLDDGSILRRAERVEAPEG